MIDDFQPVSLAHRIAAVRRFNRFYTRIIGVLQEGLLHSRFSLTEARVLYELAQRADVTATELGRELDLDPGYLSRILQRFERDGLLARAPSPADRRQSLLSLTEAGRDAFAPLDARSREEVGDAAGAVCRTRRRQRWSPRWGASSRCSAARDAARPWLLRQHRPGDIGWVVARHGALYAEEYGFDARFEALVARVAGEFLAQHDPPRERCWIAERDGVNVGSVFLVRKSDEEAKLRLLLVEPAARGLGIGRRLVEECIGFARQHRLSPRSRYGPTTCWSRRARSTSRPASAWWPAQPHRDFGPPMVGEDWELALR